ncbi:VWA domain-containing protein [Aromatoleum toluolicum]|uniref:VWA domain-containing protein n=1 Tax=Aromatoleum toluolicum TaxID=90060 RepID=A0ABX1NMF1_9RHOO|nr:VWA domain-containing protein [Aromatoleum toluolicum]NMG00514.1 VWA domain-containing protein [Aromatoleum toluolicum]
MSFLWPWLLTLLPLPWLVRRWLPPAGAPVGTAAVLRVPSLAPFAAPTTTASETRTQAPERRRVSFDLVLATLAWVLLVLAAARPLGPADPTALPVSGRELMLALDVSASMATADLRLDGPPVTRLDAARRLAQHFVAGRDGDRMGLIVFGKQAYLQTPLTFDLNTVHAALDDTAIGLAGRETALGDAIALATTRLREFRGSERVLVLLTDGANTAGQLSPEQAGWIARREGLRIHVVGIGAEPERASVPTQSAEIAVAPVADLDETTLQALANQTGGTYRRATDGRALADFYRRVDRLEPQALGQVAMRPARELYPWPLAAALLIAVVLGVRRLQAPTEVARA